jgi:hypothetical protein
MMDFLEAYEQHEIVDIQTGNDFVLWLFSGCCFSGVR